MSRPAAPAPAAAMAFPHLDDLERRYDGAVPPRLKDAARARDRAERVTFIPRLAPRRRFPSADALVAAMARLMVERAVIAYACTKDDLLAAGFTAAELGLYGEMACVRAAAAMADRRRR